MSGENEHPRDLQHVYVDARHIQSDIEQILRKYFSWLSFLDEKIVSFYAYDTLIDYVGRKENGTIDLNNQHFEMPASTSLWFIRPILKILYHYILSNTQKISSKFKIEEVHSSILFLPVTKRKPHLLSIIRNMLSARGYSCSDMAVTSNNVFWESRETFSKNSIPYTESLLSMTNVFQIVRAVNRIFRTFNSALPKEFSVNVFNKYGINNDNVKNTILKKILYGLTDNIEYGMIGRQISSFKPLAVISEVVKYGKVPFIFSYLNKAEIPTIGLQHGILINPFDYYPSSKYFGCSSLYSKKKIESITEDKNKFYFIAGLPEQMSRNKPKYTNSVENKISLGIVDSTETIVLYRMQMIDIIEKSKLIGKFKDLWVKSHPRVAKGDRIEDWLTLSNFRSLGKSNWDEFSSKVNTAITFSFDAVYELMKMKKVTIMLNPANRFDATGLPRFRNLKIIRTAFELDAVLMDILEGKSVWDITEESRINHFLDYVYGKKDDEAYVRSLVDVLDGAAIREQ